MTAQDGVTHAVLELLKGESPLERFDAGSYPIKQTVNAGVPSAGDVDRLRGTHRFRKRVAGGR